MQVHRAQYGKLAGEKTLSDVMRMHVMRAGWTMRVCRDDDPICKN
ncbi:hypothetical protein [Clostridioides sp. ES-S-0010-02]